MRSAPPALLPSPQTSWCRSLGISTQRPFAVCCHWYAGSGEHLCLSLADLLNAACILCLLSSQQGEYRGALEVTAHACAGARESQSHGLMALLLSVVSLITLLRRHDLLARPLSLWNHLDVDFAEETKMCIQKRGSLTSSAVAMSPEMPLVSPQALLPVIACQRCNCPAQRGPNLARQDCLHNQGENGHAHLFILQGMLAINPVRSVLHAS